MSTPKTLSFSSGLMMLVEVGTASALRCLKLSALCFSKMSWESRHKERKARSAPLFPNPPADFPPSASFFLSLIIIHIHIPSHPDSLRLSLPPRNHGEHLASLVCSELRVLRYGPQPALFLYKNGSVLSASIRGKSSIPNSPCLGNVRF